MPQVQDPLPLGDPKQLGFCTDRLKRFDHYLESAIAQNTMPGTSVLIARGGQIAYRTCVGLRNREAATPMQLDTVFRIASMSKAIVCTGVMMLYEEGHIQLGDPISKYIPEFAEPRVFAEGDETVPAKSEITILQLLTHTSGLSYGFDQRLQPLAEKAGLMDHPTALTTGEIVRGIARLPLDHHPGEAWTYGTSIDVLGHLIEVLSDMRLDTFLSERIFVPLGMVDTGFFVPQEKRHRLMPNYISTENGFVRMSKDPHSLGTMNLTEDIVCQESQSFHMGGGGLASTLHDYVRFAQTLLNGGQLDGTRLLGRKTVDRMTINSIGDLEVNVAADLQGDKMGLGLGIRGDRGRHGGLESIGSFGWAGGFGSVFWVDPAEDLVGVVMSQAGLGNFVDFMNGCRALTYQALID